MFRKQIFRNILVYILLVLLFISSLLLFYSVKNTAWAKDNTSVEKFIFRKSSTQFSDQFIDFSIGLPQNIQQELKHKEDQAIELAKLRTIESKINKLNSAFANYGGYMTIEHARTMVLALERCGGDYRILGALAGNESGFGRINYKLYNPFGYLNGVQYASYTEALDTLSCKIASQYLVPCNNDIVCIGNIGYTGSDTDVPKWRSNMTFFYNYINNQ